MTDIGQYYILEMLRFFNDKGVRHFAKLDIWDANFVKLYKIVNPQTIIDKLITKYLRITKKITNFFLVKGIDYVLKKVY